MQVLSRNSKVPPSIPPPSQNEPRSVFNKPNFCLTLAWGVTSKGVSSNSMGVVFAEEVLKRPSYGAYSARLLSCIVSYLSGFRDPSLSP